MLRLTEPRSAGSARFRPSKRTQRVRVIVTRGHGLGRAPTSTGLRRYCLLILATTLSGVDDVLICDPGWLGTLTNAPDDLAEWSRVGSAAEISPGHDEFKNAAAMHSPERFYRTSAP